MRQYRLLAAITAGDLGVEDPDWWQGRNPAPYDIIGPEDSIVDEVAGAPLIRQYVKVCHFKYCHAACGYVPRKFLELV